jgi:hypothetical protein
VPLNEPNRAVTQAAIREVVEVIRRWYLTICHDLCIPPPGVRIHKPTFAGIYNISPAGLYEPDLFRVTLFIVGEKMQEHYVLILAHELRHAYQHRNNLPMNERDAEEYMHYCIKRFEKGPETGEYTGPIEGLSVFIRCRKCGERIEASKGGICPSCLRRDARESVHANRENSEPNNQGFEAKSLAVPSTDTRSLGERFKLAFQRWQQDKNNLAATQSLQYKINNIDNHPANGHPGWWRIEEAYYVFAASAGDAIMKIASEPISDCPSIEYLGENLPRNVRRSMNRSVIR